ncbi:MAG: response regulator [Proteobacteria bacterium]|nr:response regulator [Pseudomonadota bacterium]
MTSEDMADNKGGILVVDDTPANLRLLTELLKTRGYSVRPVPNGRLALSGAQAIPPDLILLDVKMPEMDGYEVCRQLKSNESTAAIPVIFISALTDTTDKLKGFSAGGVDFITKPFQESEVLARVETHISLQKVQNEVEKKNVQLQEEITERKKIENELIEYRNHLEELVSERTTALTGTNEKLRQEIEKRKRVEINLKESHKRLQRLSAYQEAVREAERTRIAREIHDELGHVLTALKIDVSWLQDQLPQDNEQLRKKTLTILELINRNITTVQRISRDLRPGLLDDLGLIDAIEWQTQEYQERTEIECRLDLNVNEGLDLNPELTTVVFRIYQEILSNIARHAGATRATIGFTKQQNRIELKVSDNGRGITQAQVDAPDSFGLMGIQERLYPWKGTFEIQGKTGHGTTITVSIPLTPGRMDKP